MKSFPAAEVIFVSVTHCFCRLIFLDQKEKALRFSNKKKNWFPSSTPCQKFLM